MKKFTKSILGGVCGLLVSPIAIIGGLVAVPLIAYKVKRTPEFGLGSSIPASLLFAILWGITSPVISIAYAIMLPSVLASDIDERKVLAKLGLLEYVLQGSYKRQPLLESIKQERFKLEKNSTELLLAEFLIKNHAQNQADPNVINIVKDYLDGGDRISFYNDKTELNNVEDDLAHSLRRC